MRFLPFAKGKGGYQFAGGGVTSDSGGGGGSGYVLPPATSSTLGGVKVGAGLTIDSGGTLSASGGSGGGGMTLITSGHQNASGLNLGEWFQGKILIMLYCSEYSAVGFISAVVDTDFVSYATSGSANDYRVSVGAGKLNDVAYDIWLEIDPVNNYLRLRFGTTNCKINSYRIYALN